ncbi:MAG: polynucleotide adenylyltransferase PcnB, partial [Legionellaceae bacterium]|nr:polynucleotide adenylyltransferase PcnB [Legionellaceae bacterium]
LTPALFEQYPAHDLIQVALESTDQRISENKPVTPAFLMAAFLWFPLQEETKRLQEEEGLFPLPALEKAMSQVIAHQNKHVSIPRRFGLMMREMWLLQYRFTKRQGHRAFLLMQHPRFRAAYDFLGLRTLVKEEDPALMTWWTTFQEVDDKEKRRMILEVSKGQKKKKT